MRTVCRRYGERIYSYDVVNEAVQPETGEIRDTNVTRALGGERFLDLMFHTARAEGAACAARLQRLYELGAEQRRRDAHARRAQAARRLSQARDAGRCARRPVAHPLAEARARGAIVRESEGPWRRFLDEVVGMGYKLLITEFDVNDQDGTDGNRVRATGWSPIMRKAYLDLMLSYPQLARRALLGHGRPLQLARTGLIRAPTSCPSAARPYDARFRPSRCARRLPRHSLRQPRNMDRSVHRALLAAALLASSAASGVAAAPREITIDVAQARQPLDRFFDLSIGSDYPGTLIRADAQAQLKPAVDELGFRYIRFHAIFHDVLGTVKVVNGRPAYDWSGVDKLYDALLAKGIKPFVELGFTPEAIKTSDSKIFWWKGNTSHPSPDEWQGLVDPSCAT